MLAGTALLNAVQHFYPSRYHLALLPCSPGTACSSFPQVFRFNTVYKPSNIAMPRSSRSWSSGVASARPLIARSIPVASLRVNLPSCRSASCTISRDDPGPAVLDAEPLDEGLERAVFAVMPELRAEHVEGNAFACRVGGVGEGERGVGVVEAPDEPGGGDPIDVRPRPGHPRAAGRRQRSRDDDRRERAGVPPRRAGASPPSPRGRGPADQSASPGSRWPGSGRAPV